MTTETLPTPGTRPATPGQLDWLRGELAAWRSEGLIDDDLAHRLAGRYHATRRLSVGRLLLALGALFVGVGLIWLVAANLDELSPLARFVAVAAIWLALLAGGEALAARQVGHPAIPRPLVHSVRLLGALAFGAVVFQAAQSLQVPAYEPRLVGLWAAGALLQAYVVRAVGPLLVALLAGTGWYLWQTLAQQPSGLTVVVALSLLAVVGLSMASVHGEGRFAAPWRELGVALGLAGLFAAALPFVHVWEFAWSAWLVIGVAVAAVAVAVALAVGRGSNRLEPVAGLGVAAAAVLLVGWESGTDIEAVGAAEWAHAAVSVGLYVVVAVGVAVLGTLHDSWRLTALATLALVVFTTTQSFAVFAPIFEGAWLFVVLGLVFLGSGVAFDRARRQLASAIEGEGR